MCVLKVKVISLPYIFRVLYVLCFSRPRYQMSVHRTIGPLVCFGTCTNQSIQILMTWGARGMQGT